MPEASLVKLWKNNIFGGFPYIPGVIYIYIYIYTVFDEESDSDRK